MNTIFLAAGLLAGFLLAYIIITLWHKAKTVSKAEFDNLRVQWQEAVSNLKLYTDRLQSLQAQHHALTEKLTAKESEAAQLQAQAAVLQTNLANTGSKAAELGTGLEQAVAANRELQSGTLKYQQQIAELTAKLNGATELWNTATTNAAKQQQEITEAAGNISKLHAENSKLTANNAFLAEKLNTQKQEIEYMQQKAHLQFEKIAQQLLEEKSARFTEANKVNMEALLNPLKEDIGKFKTKVEETYDKESRQRFSLEARVKELIEQTNKVSAEANNLATALKGQTKKQGNWGEMILESILEASGLTKDREYFVQPTIKNEDGRNLRPDILVKLPDTRVIIIDSKVSLLAYDRLVAADDTEEQKLHAASHLRSIYDHINDLNGKQYDNLETSLDFTMMFVPIEPAYMVAIQADPDLWSYAYARRILLISPTNLIACLKLISDLWNREKQSRNAMDIVKRGELLYEKFVNFTTSLEEVGRHLNKTQTAYTQAMDQLKSGRGNLISQAVQLKSLGLKSSKKITPSLLPVDMEAPGLIDERQTEEGSAEPGTQQEQ